MGYKICKYCLASTEVEYNKTYFYTCGKCFKKIKETNPKHCNKIVIAINNLIKVIDKRINDESKSKNNSEFVSLLKRVLNLKKYVHSKIDEGKL